MVIPEAQLETWSRQGAIATAKATADSVRNALDYYSGWPDGIEYEVYLQGSYKNDTNIRGDSDVDVVAQLNSTHYSNLSDDQKRILSITPASYRWTEFKADVVTALNNYYGQTAVNEGSKAINVIASNGRLPADVIACAQYKRFKTVNIYDYIEGMCFWDQARQIINYPKIHYDNGVTKHQNSNQWYKPSVRIFKNMRNYINNSSPSYFLECLLFNVPNAQYNTSFQNTFFNIVNLLKDADMSSSVCQNGQLSLFGDTPEQWNTYYAKQLVQALIGLWNNWGT